MVNYTPFLNFLRVHSNDELNCTFEKIESFIGGSLPNSAYKFPAWWSNHPTHPLMKEILKIGWMSKNLNLKNKTISFYKDSTGMRKLTSKKLKNNLKRQKPIIDLTKENEYKKQRDNELKQNPPDFVLDGKNIYFEHILDDFISQITKGKIEIYNEASVQYELAIFLREIIPNYKIQLERNVTYFKQEKKNFVKKEIDIVLFNHTQTKKFAIEIKFPINGEYPIQMFHFCQDVKFLEQLKESGFTDNFFLAITTQSNFWSDQGREGTIYEKFRKEKELYGEIKNQIGDSIEKVTLNGRYKINWLTINDTMRYFVMRI